MIRNISDKPITIKWDAREAVIQPKEQVDVRDLNVPQDHVLLVEQKIGAKHTGLVEIVHTKAEMMSLKEIRKQQEEIVRKEKEIEAREKALAEKEEGSKKSKK